MTPPITERLTREYWIDWLDSCYPNPTVTRWLERMHCAPLTELEIEQRKKKKEPKR